MSGTPAEERKAALEWLHEMARHSAHVRRALVVLDMLANARESAVRECSQAVAMAAWKHCGDDPYSQGMDTGARTQLKECLDAVRALIPPRKTTLAAWAIIDARGGGILQLRSDPPAGVATGIERLVKLTGEYEEPWS